MEPTQRLQSPKIVGIVMVRDEADVIETFVRYHLQFCDEMIITDNLSSDGCSDILEAMAAESARVKLLHDRRSGFFQPEVMTQMLRTAARELKADWVLALDADEFLATDPGRGIREIVEGFPLREPIRIPWRTYVPRPEDDFRGGNVLECIRYRRSAEGKPYFKILVPRHLAENDDIELSRGNHKLLDRSRPVRPEIHGADTANLFLGHFPIRSASQLIKKAVIGWTARIAAPEQWPRISSHSHPLFERVKSGGEPSAEELTAMALAYPSDPGSSPPAGEIVLRPIRYDPGELTLRHEDLIVGSPIAALANLAEGLALDLSTHRAELASLKPGAAGPSRRRRWAHALRHFLGSFR